MGKIRRTYPRYPAAQAALVPAASTRLIFVRRTFAQRVPFLAWFATFVSLLLLAWPSA